MNGCAPGEEPVVDKVVDVPDYGRTAEEKLRDEKLHSEQFFNDHELSTIAVLCDLILPAKGTAGSAVDAGVPEFIEFVAKDMTSNQLPLRGGMMWLDNQTNKKYAKEFKSCTADEQKSLLDEIAYPDDTKPESEQGTKFFGHLRNLVLTGYYTTKMGFDDLGYKGNVPNIWDGVPQEVLDKHGMAYEQEWLSKCVDQEKRDIQAEWDDKGNLLT